MMEESGGIKLIRDCIDHLNSIQKEEKGDNRALFPVVIVFFGQHPVEYFSTIRDTLKINWPKDAALLKYLNIVKTEDGFTCSNLMTGEKSQEDPLVFVEKAVVEMLGEERAFEEKSRTRFEHILSGEDEDGTAYYDFMIRMKLGSHYNIFKTMFVMMDESEPDKRRKIHKLLNHITENRENTKHELGTVYLLSNYLKGGGVLKNHKLNLNYRLVADLILLGGNNGTDKHNSAISTIENFDTVKTAGYALVEKPVRGITIVSLQKMMKYLKEENERMYRESAGDVLQSAEKIQDKLGIQRGKIRCLEEIFQESILRILPSPGEIQYLAYVNEQEYKNIYKEKRVSAARLDRATGGNWNLFFEENYTDKVMDLLSDDKFMSGCLEKIRKNWRSVLSYGDALYGLDDGRVMNALEEFAVASSAPPGNSIEEGVHFWAVEETRRLFYSHMNRHLSRMLSEIHQDAKTFRQAYVDLEGVISEQSLDNQEESSRHHYENLAENYLRQDSSQILSDMFRLKNGEDKIIQELESAFKRLIKTDMIYAMSFEEELQTRLTAMSDVDRVLMIKSVLEEKIENKIRLHGRGSSYVDNVRGVYYLMKEGADYAKEIDTSRQFTIFHLNRTDCIEKIAIYDLDTPEKYCNLIEMVGEV